MKKQFCFQFISITLCLLLCLGLCACGSGQKAPTSITFTLDGEEVDTVEMLNGTEQGGLTAVVEPADLGAEIIWTSEDSGIVKVSSADGNTCSLTAKKDGSTRVTATCNGVSASVRVHVEKDPDNLTQREIALTVNGRNYSAEECNIYYAQLYYDFLEQYGSTADSYGIDTSRGIGSLAKQTSEYSDDGTWAGYFIGLAVNRIPQVQALCDYAKEQGVTLDADDEAEVNKQLAKVEDKAEEQGYATTDEYVADAYGDGVTLEMLRTYFEDTELANKVYDAYEDSLTYTEEELSQHYLDMGYEAGTNDYPTAAMRHILIKAEADADGNTTDEAIAAAHERAEEIYAEWQAGEATEDSFAALARKYSDDTSSIADGGLYDGAYQGQMVPGINSWLFDETRTPGDTAVIDNNGSYIGTHVVYFVGYEGTYWRYLALDDLRDTDASEWFTALCADYTSTEGMDYSSIGNVGT